MISAASTFGIETVAISKRFGSLTALDDVSIKVEPGTVHALLGENGAGKSTLVKCIMGYYRPDSGSVLIDNREQDIPNPRTASAFGIGMVYQHFTLVPGMTVLENLVLARPRIPTVINWSREQEQVRGFLEDMPFQVPLDEPVARLAAGEKQKAEILKQLYLDQRFLILDEPTSVLTPAEADEVLGKLQDMTKVGTLTVLMITHKFREVTAFADSVSVLRRGRHIGSGAMRDFDAPTLAKMMVGEAIAPPAPQSANTYKPGKEKLVLQNLSAEDDVGDAALDGISLNVRSGEIVGIAGVSGNGQKELVEVLAGQRSASAGEISVDGERYNGRRSEIRARRVSCLPEEPLRNACVAQMSIAENMALHNFDARVATKFGWLVNSKALKDHAVHLIHLFNVKTPGPDVPIGTLSGGNVQRAVLGRELESEPELLVAANPCFGLDFKAAQDIRQGLVTARNRGAAVLLVSEDLDEIFDLSDRILVMFDGRIVHETSREQASLSIIGQHMAGHT